MLRRRGPSPADAAHVACARREVCVARAMLDHSAMTTPRASSNDSWTIPFHVIMWTTITVGLIMAMAVLLMK
jgi:hypothetical protein